MRKMPRTHAMLARKMIPNTFSDHHSKVCDLLWLYAKK